MNRRNILKTFILSLFPVLAFAACMKMKGAAHKDIKADFEYREIYLPEGSGEYGLSLDLNDVNNDWGIWGHNIRLVIPDNHSENIYAKKNGVTIHDQYSFMSNHLFDYYADYIDSKYDETDSLKFAIVPNDNDIVCLCAKCVDAGNTQKDASPAVLNMAKRLAERFPNHQFFTSYYRTTSSIPKEKLPKNIGVLVSAMEYPLSNAPSGEEDKFVSLLNQWSQVSDHVYVWDYINNFDDYFTPYPIFDIMQRRLKLYRDNGVKGIFLNGSGTNYSAFSNIHTDVLAALTVNPDTDWKKVLRESALKHFPTAGNIIADFMIQQEDYAKSTNAQLPLYEGIKAELKTYLPENEFIDFHNKLISLKNQASGDELRELEKLCGALAMTCLEIDRLRGDLSSAPEMIALLSALPGMDINSYNESNWTVEHYLRDYNRLLEDHNATASTNLLKGMQITSHSTLDPDYKDLSILTDGVLGIPSNYHSGNMLYSGEGPLKLEIPRVGGMKKIRVGFVYNPPYKIVIPIDVSLYIGGRLVKNIEPGVPDDHSGHLFVEFDVPADGNIMLMVTRDPDVRSIAIDEIQAF